MNKRKFKKVTGTLLITVTVIVVGTGIKSTYEAVHGTPNQTVSEMITSHSRQVAKQALQRERQANPNVKKDYRVTPNKQDAKRLPIVAKYINTNERSHGLEKVVYDKRNHKLVFRFNHKTPVNTRVQYTKRLENEFSAK